MNNDIFETKHPMMVVNCYGGINNLGCNMQGVTYQVGMANEYQPQDASTTRHDASEPDELTKALTPIFKGNPTEVRKFLQEVDGQSSKSITERVNALMREEKIVRAMAKRDLWTILHQYGIYKCTLSNWNSQVN